MVRSPAHGPHYGWSTSLSFLVGKALEGAVGWRGPMHSSVCSVWDRRSKAGTCTAGSTDLRELPLSLDCVCSPLLSLCPPQQLLLHRLRLGTCKDGKCISAAPTAPAAPTSPAVRLVLSLWKGIWYPGLCLRRGIRQVPAVPDVGKVPSPQAQQLYKNDSVFHTHGSALFAMFFYRKCVNDNTIG